MSIDGALPDNVTHHMIDDYYGEGDTAQALVGVTCKCGYENEYEAKLEVNTEASKEEQGIVLNDPDMTFWKCPACGRVGQIANLDVGLA